MKVHFSKLDALRGIAAFAVVLFHSPFYFLEFRSDFVKNSYLFVDLFFILSGFVLAYAYRAKVAEGMKFRDFILVRLGRIYPMHFLMLIIWAGYLFFKWILFQKGLEVKDPSIASNANTFLSNLLLLHSLNLHHLPSFNYPSWSISLEFFTYLLFFPVAWVIRGRKYLLIAACAISLFCYFYLFRKMAAPSFDFTLVNGIFRCVGGFFLGMAVYEVRKFGGVKNRWLNGILEVAAVLAVYFAVFFADRSIPMIFAAIASFAFAIFIFSGDSDGIFGWLLKKKFFQDAGAYSYSVYMLHALLFDIGLMACKYLIMEPSREEVFFFQSGWAWAINAFFLLLIFFAAKFTYEKIEAKWLAKAKGLVSDMNEMEKKDEGLSILA